jgi:hypothetical protein
LLEMEEVEGKTSYVSVMIDRGEPGDRKIPPSTLSDLRGGILSLETEKGTGKRRVDGLLSSKKMSGPRGRDGRTGIRLC